MIKDVTVLKTKTMEDYFSDKNIESKTYNDLLLNDVNNEGIKIFTAAALKQYGTIDKLAFAEQSVDMLTKMFTEAGFLVPNARQDWIDCVICAVYIHNLFTVEGEWETVFDARVKLIPILNELLIPESAYDPIFQTVEAQLGDKMPVTKCRVVKNSPMELFFWAIWFVKTQQ